MDNRTDQKNLTSICLSVDGRFNCGNKAAFSNFSGTVWALQRWFKKVSSTFQDVDFDVSLLPVFIT